MLPYQFEPVARREITNLVDSAYSEHRRKKKVKPKPKKPIIAKSQKHFPQFSKLPQEIRLKIWDMVTDEPRAVIIHARVGPGGGIRSPTPVPSALHVCFESREVALKKYELTFSARDARFGGNCPARIWFNFDKDIAYFRNRGGHGWVNLRNFRLLVSTKDLKKIKFLGIDIEVCNSPRSGLFRGPPLYWATNYGVMDFQEWTGLEAVFRCHENLRMNTNKTLMVNALRGNKEWVFAMQYMRIFGKDGRFEGLSLSTAIEKIKLEAMASAGFRGIGTAEVHLSTISNS